MYLMRLDDASEHRDISKWNQMQELLNKFDVKPIFGIIPDCQDPSLLRYPKDELFWDTVYQWIGDGWTPAMHGYQHVFRTKRGG